MSPGVASAEDVPRHGHDLPALLRRVPRSDERAAARAGLDDDHPPHEPADQAIPLGKVMAERRRSRRELAQYRARSCDRRRERRVLGGVDDVDTRAEDGDSDPFAFECAPMGRCVHTARAPAHHRDTAAVQVGRQKPRHGDGVRRRGSRADDRHRGPGEHGCIPLQPENRGAIVESIELPEIARIAPADRLDAAGGSGVQRLQGTRPAAPAILPEIRRQVAKAGRRRRQVDAAPLVVAPARGRLDQRAPQPLPAQKQRQRDLIDESLLCRHRRVWEARIEPSVRESTVDLRRAAGHDYIR